MSRFWLTCQDPGLRPGHSQKRNLRFLRFFFAFFLRFFPLQVAFFYWLVKIALSWHGFLQCFAATIPALGRKVRGGRGGERGRGAGQSGREVVGSLSLSDSVDSKPMATLWVTKCVACHASLFSMATYIWMHFSPGEIFFSKRDFIRSCVFFAFFFPFFCVFLRRVFWGSKLRFGESPGLWQALGYGRHRAEI